MVMNSGEMKPASSKQIEFQIRQLKVRQANRDEDFKGADVFLNDLPVAHRGRNYKSTDFKGQTISIRKRDFSKSDYEKIINGEYLAKFWIFEYPDAYILCLTKDIRGCLLQEGLSEYRHNKNEPNGAYYIFVDDIPHLRIDKP